jgi:hypothetical protein
LSQQLVLLSATDVGTRVTLSRSNRGNHDQHRYDTDAPMPAPAMMTIATCRLAMAAEPIPMHTLYVYGVLRR